MLSAPKSKTWLWVVVALVAVLVLVFALYYYYNGYTPASEGATGADSVESLEQDLQIAGSEELGAELDSIEQELQQ